MTDATTFALSLVAAYLLGAVPFGFLVARAQGIDIRTVGSGNIGATNVFRSISKGWGIFTFVCDFLKGGLPVFLFPALARAVGAAPPSDALALLCGLAAIAGHNWPIFLKFKGGKGVATSAGVVLGIAPLAVGMGIIIWVVAFVLSRYVSLASMLAAAAIAISAWIMGPIRHDTSVLVPTILSLMAILIIGRHHANIRRLLSGTENRFQFKKETTQS